MTKTDDFPLMFLSLPSARVHLIATIYDLTPIPPGWIVVAVCRKN